MLFFFAKSHCVCVCVGALSRHMKIHEKDPNSAAAAAPPSPLKRRRLSSKRKLSHDAESEKEDPAPAKKVLSSPSPDVPNHGTPGRNTPGLCFRSGGWPVLPTRCEVPTEDGVCAASACFPSYNGSCLGVGDLYSPCLAGARCSVNTCRMDEWVEGRWVSGWVLYWVSVCLLHE